jgi:hypothetical protein
MFPVGAGHQAVEPGCFGMVEAQLGKENWPNL